MIVISKLWEIIRGARRIQHVLIPNATDLIFDRIKFKFYASEKHLFILQRLLANGETLHEDSSRIKFEIEMEELLSHLIGSIDSLLFRINKKLGLGIKDNRVCLSTVNEKLESIGRADLLQDLNHLLDDKGSWLSILYELRNAGMHRTIIPKRVQVSLNENTNTNKGSSDPNKTYFAADPESKLEMVPYLEDRIQKVKGLIKNISQKEPSLVTP